MIHNQLKIVNKNKGVKISNARVGLGGTGAFTLNSGGSPAKRAKAGGQKGRGYSMSTFAVDN